MKQQWAYTGREIESMDFAVNYHRWIFDVFRPYLGERIVEVGAGVGAFSAMVLETKPESLVMLEPAANLYPRLIERIPGAHALQNTLREAVPTISSPDSILYVNVLEHIEDDEAELAAVHSVLAPGGRVLIFVPANRWLMSEMDRLMGHYRRYTLSELSLKCRSAGFEIRHVSRFDILGIVPWLVKYRLLKSRKMGAGLVKLYDRMIVPIARIAERMIPPPLGKSIILVGEKKREKRDE